MYTTPGITPTSIKRNESVDGEMLEQKVERIVNNKEPIKDGAPLIYIDRKEGVRRSTNIRTDRFEVAIEATDKIAMSYKARREERAKAPEGGQAGEKVGGAEPTGGSGATDSKPTT